MVHERKLLSELKLVGDTSHIGDDEYRAIEITSTKSSVFDSIGKFMITDVKTPPYKIYGKLQKNIDKDYYVVSDYSLVVSHINQNFNLDTTDFSDAKSRRQGRTGSKSYVIPHGDTSFDNTAQFKKIIRALMSIDKKITGDYEVVGNPKYDGMTISDVLGESTSEGQNIVSGASFKPMKFYHGTSKVRYDKMKASGIGLAPNQTPEVYGDLIPDYSEHNVYLTTSVSEAENYATRAAIDDKSLAVVLRVIVRDPTKFVIDEDASGGWMDGHGHS